ncbi:MAG: LPS export ABC transporter periplasmic protein LptC [Burkholderiaceae bacterium]|jgi:lipopolysaccharide export system protein LptC
MRDRGTLVGSLVLLSSLAAGSYWLAERARLSDPVPRRAGHQIDYFAENFNLTRMDDKGNALYSVNSARMTHFADDDSTVLTNPEITSARPDSPTVHMRANSGNVTSDAEQVTLKGGVLITRAATANNPELRASGTYLEVYPEEDIAKSNQPFLIEQGGSRIVSQTLVFDNTNRTIKMNEGVRARGEAIFEPQMHKSAKPSAAKVGP